MIPKVNCSLPKSKTSSELDDSDPGAVDKKSSAQNPKTLSFELMFDTFEEQGDIHSSMRSDVSYISEKAKKS